MSERDAFLAAIIAEPADDVRRLAFADWLQENGEEDRAEFIRVQCRSEHEAPCRSCSVWSLAYCPEPGCKYGSDDRAAALLNHIHRPMPNPHFIGGGGPGETRVGYFWRRGFIWSACWPAADCLAHLSSIITAHPIQRVRLTTRPEAVTFDHGLRMFRLEGREVIRQYPDLIGEPYTEGEVIERLLESEWPGIRFELPAAEPAHV